MNTNKKWWSDSRLYLILDKQACGARDPGTVLKKAILGGVDIVQYRDKISPSKAMISQSRRLSRICRSRGIPFLVNDRLDVALDVPCDGIHLGQDDCSVSLLRAVLGKDAIIGLSCHTPDQVRDAQQQAADYLGFGPVFRTKTKPGACPRGTEELTRAIKISNKPVVAIGGITLDTITLLPKEKPMHIAVCRAICSVQDVAAATREIKRRLRRTLKCPTI